MTADQEIKAPQEADLVVIGGGITGLSAAYLAAKAGKKVTLLEAGENFGGLLHTFTTQSGEPLEAFYHHFFTHDAEINWLIQELGIEQQLFFRKTTMGVFREGRMYAFNSPADLFRFRPIHWLDKFKFGVSSLFLARWAKWEKYEHVSCLNWFQRWAGKSSTAALWKPMLDIKFGPFADKVPLAWMIGRLRQRVNSRKQGEEKLGYLRGSMKTLLNALLKTLEKEGVELALGEPVIQVNAKDTTITSIQTEKRTLQAQKYLFTIPTTGLAKLFIDFPRANGQLQSQAYFGAACLILEMDRPLSETYWLNVADPGFPFGGVIEHTNFVSPKEYGGKHLAYLSRYFDLEEDFAHWTTAEIEKQFIAKLPEIYPDFNPAQIEKTYLFRTETAAPVCDLNFSDKVLPCHAFFDNCYHIDMTHIYPDERSVNNSIRIAAEACRVMKIDAPFVPKNLSLSGQIGF
ncbi:MAG: NAD(P)/FAD-dependent oxidoreductase [Salibacteraceae bacterium]